MWGLLGDHRTSPPGTYYYECAEHVCYHWNAFDQVLIRPALIKRFQLDELKILTNDGTAALICENGLPDANAASDHLPIVFALDLEKWNQAMSQATRDFWPTDLTTGPVATPVAILREQAALLGEKTGGLVLGQVRSVAVPGDLLVHHLFLTVPALGDYRYELLNVQHSIKMSPIEVYYGPAGYIRGNSRLCKSSRTA